MRFNLDGESAEKPAGAGRAGVAVCPGVAGRHGVEILTRRLSVCGEINGNSPPRYYRSS